MIGGGDVAMEEALFLARYGSKVYIVQRFDYLEVQGMGNLLLAAAARRLEMKRGWLPESVLTALPLLPREEGLRGVQKSKVARGMKNGGDGRAGLKLKPPPCPALPCPVTAALQSSKVMARRAVTHPKIEVLWETECLEAYGGDDGGLGRVQLFLLSMRA